MVTSGRFHALESLETQEDAERCSKRHRRRPARLRPVGNTGALRLTPNLLKPLQLNHQPRHILRLVACQEDARADMVLILQYLALVLGDVGADGGVALALREGIHTVVAGLALFGAGRLNA